MAIDESYIIRLKAEVDSYISDVTKAGAVTESTQKNIETSFNKVTAAMKKNQQGFQGVGRNAGQAGIQIQQFVGQVQGGQSVMLALSQQATDLGFVLGAPLLGAVAGITASVIAMGTAFFDASTDTDSLIDKLKELKKQGELTTNQQAALAQARAKDAEETKKRLVEIEKEIKTNEEYLNQAERRIITGRSSEALEKNRTKQIKETKESLVLLRAEQDTLNQSLENSNEISKTAIKLADDLKSSREALQSSQFAGQVSISSGDSPEVTRSKTTTQLLKAQQIQRFEEQKEILIANNQSTEDLEILHQQRMKEIREQGAADVSKIEDAQFDKTVSMYQGVATSVISAYSAINSNSMQSTIDSIRSNEALALNEAKTEEERVKIRNNAQMKIEAVERKQFEENKKGQIANAIINTAAGVTKALPNIPLAVATGVMGAAQIATIASARYGGGSTGSFSAVSSSAGSESEEPSVTVSETDISTGQSSTTTLVLADGTELATGVLEGQQSAENDGRGDLF